MKRALPEGVREPLDYAREGRVFCGIELYEGEAMAKSINELLGDGVIMYQSDYPHNGCEYPNSPDIALQLDRHRRDGDAQADVRQRRALPAAGVTSAAAGGADAGLLERGMLEAVTRSIRRRSTQSGRIIVRRAGGNRGGPPISTSAPPR